MERELSKNMRKEKFGGGYYYRFCDEIEKNSKEEIVGRIKEEMERITNPPRYDMGLSCGLTYNEERKIWRIKEILDSREYCGLEIDKKLNMIDKVLRQDNSDAFCITTYSNKLDKLKDIVKDGIDIIYEQQKLCVSVKDLDKAYDYELNNNKGKGQSKKDLYTFSEGDKLQLKSISNTKSGFSM